MYQIDLFRFVDPFNLYRSPALRQTFQWRIAIPNLGEAGTLSELFLIKKYSVRTLLDVMSEPDGCKGSPDIEFNHDLFEIVIDLKKERGGWLLLVQGFETNSMFFSKRQIGGHQAFGRCGSCEGQM
jgi:hypothetical protein